MKTKTKNTMINLEKFEDGTELNLFYVTSKFSGYGHYTITAELEYKGKYKELSKTTDNMPAHDDATELEGDEKKESLYRIIELAIKDSVEEWMQGVDFDEEAEDNI